MRGNDPKDKKDAGNPKQKPVVSGFAFRLFYALKGPRHA
jgi:hypothetical protein